MRFTADLRMYRHSGIGRYLQNMLPLVLPHIHADRVRILGSRELFQNDSWLQDSRIELFETRARVYSVQEQLLVLRGAYADTDLLWVPHYNAPLRYRGKLLATIHDIAPLALPQILNSSLKRAYANLLIRRTVSQAAAILCVSAFTKKEVEQRLSVAGAKLTVTPLALDEGWPSYAESHCESDGMPYLLFVGNIKPNKNLGLLLQAFAAVRHQLPYRLVVAGRVQGFSSADDSVNVIARTLGDRIRFAGKVTDAELQRLYAGARALVVPSLYEGFGLTLLEAMQLGCPVVSSTAGSLPEVGGDAALYFDPYSTEDLQKRLLQLQDEQFVRRLRMLGSARVACFSFQRCADASVAVMNRLLAASKSGQT